METHAMNHEKISVFDRYGHLSKPFYQTIHGMKWKIMFVPCATMDGKPAINIRYSCEDFNGHDGCLVFMKFNSRFATHYFAVNKSAYMFGTAFIGVRTRPGYHYTLPYNEWWRYHDTFPGYDLLEWPYVLADFTPHNEDSVVYNPALNMNTTHYLLSSTLPVTNIYFPKWSYDDEYGKFPYEFHPQIFQCINPNVEKLLKNFYEKTEYELRELRDVLGYCHHKHKEGIIDDDIIRVELLAHQFGFKPPLSFWNLFSWQYRTPRVRETTTIRENFQPLSWEQNIVKLVHPHNNVPLVYEKKFNVDGQQFVVSLTLIKKKYNSTDYISFGIAFITAFATDIFWSTVRVSAPAANVSGFVQRCLMLGQNTMMIPTLCEYSESMEKLLAINIDITLKKIQKTVIPRNIVFPGISDFTINCGAKFMKVNKNFLMDQLEYFETYLLNEHFGGVGATEMKLDENEFAGLYHVMDSLYHKSKALTMKSFFQLGVAADLYRNVELSASWERCAKQSCAPEIRKAIHEQYKQDKAFPS